MFAYIKGSLEEIYPQKVVVEAGGIGYEIKVNQSLLSRLPEKGNMVKLYTYFNVREDAQELYGFLNKEEKAIFEKLITVSGIGPKVAMGILSSLTPTQIALSIVTNDKKVFAQHLSRKKTAQRLILELKEKIDQEALVGQADSEFDNNLVDQQNEVIEALVALGYQPQEAKKHGML